ncbi:helix-turn-helix domain-containing protein [Burkholderia cepacia]|uniref:helix-turn-helix domain-containing protein n=1 Tax=Burkholderia cepacia TaxID=292 RepID=UPI0009BF1D32|nr:helix-turn-helix domain-containing protein [Burkholderia cepacia]
MADCDYTSTTGSLSGTRIERAVKECSGNSPHYSTNDNPPAEMDKFGCPSELFSVTEAVVAGGLTFYHKKASGIDDVEIRSSNSRNSFIVEISLSARHSREILIGRDRGVYKFKKHSLNIRSSNEPYSARIHGDYDFVLADVSNAWLTRIDETTLRSGVKELQGPIGHVDDVLGNLVRCVFPIKGRPSHVNPCFAEHVGVAFCLHLLEKYGVVAAPTKARAPRLAKWQEELSKELLLCGALKSTSISDIATACHVSTSYFIRAFKATTGHSPYKWQLRERIDMAKRLLYDNELSIAVISEACGFSDLSHFSRVFANIVGTPASQWRKVYATKASKIDAVVASEKLQGENKLGGDGVSAGG